MTEQEMIDFIEDMRKFFGKLPNPEHCPIEFAYCVKVYSYIKGVSV